MRLSSVLRALLSIAILASGGWAFYVLQPPPSPKRPPDRPTLPVVQVTTATEHAEGVVIEADGVVVPHRQINLAAEVSGKVVFKADNCQAGRRVRKGEILVRIDPADYELEVRRLTEEVNTAKAQVQELETEVSTLRNQLPGLREQMEIDLRSTRRLQDMRERGAASTSELDAAQRAEVEARNRLQQQVDQVELLESRRSRLQSTLALAKANLEKAQLSLDRTKLISPVDALVAEDNVEENGYLQTGSIALVLQDTSVMDVSCKLRDGQMNLLWMQSEAGASDRQSFPTTPATVLYKLSGMTYRWEGVLDRLDGAGLDTQTRLIPCRVQVDRPGRGQPFEPEKGLNAAVVSGAEAQTRSGRTLELLSGMYVQVRIRAAPPMRLVLVPQEAVQPGNRVWVVRDGSLRSLSLSIVGTMSPSIIVAAEPNGLSVGDTIVQSPMVNPIEGAKVILRGSAEEAAQIAAAREAAKNGPKRWGS